MEELTLKDLFTEFRKNCVGFFDLVGCHVISIAEVTAADLLISSYLTEEGNAVTKY